MARKLDYRWHLRQVMAERGMFATTDLIDPLAARGIRLSSSQVYRLVVERPENPDGTVGHLGRLDGRADRTRRYRWACAQARSGQRNGRRYRRAAS